MRPNEPAIGVLGSVQVMGRPVRPAKQAALLGLLTVKLGKVVSADFLAQELWPAASAEKAYASLQVALSGLRKALADSPFKVSNERPGYVLRGPAELVDAVALRSGLEEGLRLVDAGMFAEARNVLERSVHSWRGDPFGAADVPSLALEARTLQEVLMATEEALALSDLEGGLHQASITQAQRLLERQPLRESLWRILMLGLYRAGRQAEALAAYEDLREALREALGVDPSAELQKLHRDILLQSPELEPKSTGEEVKGTGDGFFGRTRELEELRVMVREERVTTVAGIGGIGKTRLVRRLLEVFEQDHVIVELDSVDDPASVTSAIAVAAGIRESPGSSLIDALTARFDADGPLLVLDNCEHVLDGARDVVESLNQGRVLATSRTPLGVPGEKVWHIPPLDPKDAVALFRDRSTGVSEADLPSIEEICRMLDGIPLALELAAARTKILSASQIAERLESERFLETEGGPERHRALRTAIAWSVEGLDPAAFKLFRRASVFRGSFTIDDIEAICCFDGLKADELIPAISKLVDRSLISTRRSGDKVGHRMLVPIRQVAAASLDATESTALKQRHLAHFSSGLNDMEQVRTTYEDIRAALDWALNEGNAVEEGARLAGGLSGFWQTGGLLTEGRYWLSKAIEVADPKLRTTCLTALGSLCLMQADIAAASASLAEAEALVAGIDDSQLHAAIYLNLGAMAHMVGDQQKEKSYMSKAAEAAEAAEDASLKMRVANNAAWFARRRGDLTAAEQGFRDTLSAARAVGSEMGESAALLSLADIERMKGGVGEAKTCAEQALQIARRIGFTQGVSGALGTLGLIATESGEYEVAATYTQESLDLARRLGDRNFEAASLANLGAIAQAAGNLARSDRYLKDYLELAKSIDDVRHMSRANKSLADNRYAEGDMSRARDLLREALLLAMKTGEKPLMISPLALAAAIVAEHDQVLSSQLVTAVETSAAESVIHLDESDKLLLEKIAGRVGRSQPARSLEELMEDALNQLDAG